MFRNDLAPNGHVRISTFQNRPMSGKLLYSKANELQAIDRAIPVASIMPDLLPKTHLYPTFREYDALNTGLTSGLVGLGAGLFSACMKNAYFGTSSSAWTVFSVYGSTIPIYGIIITPCF